MSSTAGGEVTIIAVADRSASPGLCSWSSTGTVVDAGRWLDGDYRWDAMPARLAGRFRNEITLMGDAGTIRIRFEGVLAPTVDREVLSLEGRWSVVRGTGGYARLRGGGNALVSFAFGRWSAVGRFTGQLRSE